MKIVTANNTQGMSVTREDVQMKSLNVEHITNMNKDLKISRIERKKIV